MQLDAQLGASLKTQGQQLALTFSGPWQDVVLHEFRAWLAIEKARGFGETTIERYRAEAETQPCSPKAWGSLPRMACKAGLIAPKLREDGSQVKRKAVSAKTHAHDVAVWIIL